MCGMLKNEYTSCQHIKTHLKLRKLNYSFNDSKRRLVALSRSKKIITLYCLNSVHSFKTKSKLESRNNVCRNKDFCGIVMTSEEIKILHFNQCQESEKTPSITYANLESLIKGIDGCKNNFEKSSTGKVGEHVP